MLRYFDERIEVFLEYCRAARRYFPVEGIHGLRLEIKRLRAVCRLMDYAAPACDSKPVLRSFRKLFRSAGELRDIDICQAIALSCLNTLDLSAYLNHLKSREMNLRVLFSAAAAGFRFDRIARHRRKMRDALKAVDEKRLRKRTGAKIFQLASEMNDRMAVAAPAMDDLHAIRKLAKALQYTLDIRQAGFGNTDLASGVSDQLKKAGRHLGSWHDFLLAVASVRDFLGCEAQDSPADPAVYAAFLKSLRQKAGGSLALYRRSRKPLRRSLGLLSSEPG